MYINDISEMCMYVNEIVLYAHAVDNLKTAQKKSKVAASGWRLQPCSPVVKQPVFT